ncbi:hypothetical protein CP967_26625 [Streptomyces nitrosporeus]|uniref:Uncharacterized protein n=1 Tax=Streptomyces nitrosporeus TaxID=28894 RepID=A0A5J6FG16_9ACTN|nr:hypothetical protein [Streptomyces nitrosporeus]QEU75083.1 hypothetical protein CP967_26625 [Streptomyces nitrosporeus]GGY91060.1 hypothetical protein GCM10010327_22210 [Streptomyces nitrosporeus]
MLQCTAFTSLPPVETIVQLLMSSDPPEHPTKAVSGHAVCELGDGHDGEHADHVWDEDARDGAIWFLWNGSRHRFLALPWCPVKAAGGDACELYEEHPADHSWDVEDPVRQALWDDIDRNPDRWE